MTPNVLIEVLDMIFCGMDVKDLASLTVICWAFHNSATKPLYSKVAIVALVVPLKSKTKRLRNFLRTLLSNPTLSCYVE